jgi:long-chain acyl-CoA synthetase
MKSHDPLLARWNETLARKGDAPAILSARGEPWRTFREIEKEARAFEPALDEFAAGQVIAIQLGNHPDWPSVLLACLQRQLVILPLERSLSEHDREKALRICNVAAVVAGPSRTGLGPGGESIEVLPLRTAASTEAKEFRENPPSLLKLTSGTTAAPRAIRFGSEQLLNDCDNICQTMKITDTDLNFGVIPVSHSYGFSNLITPLIAHGVPLVLSYDRLPRAVIHDIASSGATVFPGMPVFYQSFCELEKLPELPRLRLCISAGAPLSAGIAQKFYERFKQPLHSFYGSSECGGICYDRDGTSFEDGFVGAPMQNVAIEMIDAAAESSQIKVRSAAVGDNYFPEADEEKLGGGTFVPDDLLARHDKGFKIVGRISDLINVAGKKVNPAEVETQLLRVAGVREAIVFGRKSSVRNEEVAACVVAGPNVNENELLQFCRQHLSGWQVPKRIFLVEQIPVNERGKISRRELSARFL